MRVGINCGHCLTSANSGAIGVNGIREQDETRKVGKLVIQYLQKLGHTTVDCTVDSALSSTHALRMIVDKANAQQLDLFISIHFNSSGGVGHGTELYTKNAIKLDSAVRILNNIVKLGYTDRGIKEKELYVINHTKAKAILIECCFIDNKEDMSKYNADKMAKAIAEGITGTKLPIDKPKPVETKLEDKMYYRVVVGTYKDKNLAEQQREELKKKGFDSFLLAYEK